MREFGMFEIFLRPRRPTTPSQGFSCRKPGALEFPVRPVRKTTLGENFNLYCELSQWVRLEICFIKYLPFLVTSGISWRLFESDTHVTSTTTTTATPSVRSIPLAVGRSLSHQADSMDHRDFRSSCLARTPSGSIFIPSECKVPASPLNCHLSSQLSKTVNESKTNPERCHLSYSSGVPVPVCNNVRRSSPGHYSRFQFRKSFSSRCTWKCTAIVCLFISLAILSALAYFVGKSRSLPFLPDVPEADFPRNNHA
ncbi:hypothetical protein AVEN_160374-1 [Araneus ventricosus]|uniref:Teneurin N-terminal domain-containing protein n=1 Tax=Araneus ventricosus TaxID=182803 RepID=A0A4Y2M8Q0_ARAVE|nr:hypothetical protein AVEN_160374-1 [Araneus ventricosus]